ncbi:FAD-binding oxidoreductase [Herminiimonas sp. CN]|uniref:FAD-binding oxidoreductase n=1 Tax=Herminiimonas sp. CN TaxID=1349818 RepID=UPI0004733F67|nr:FAD-binding oxidoreductase [Herminiimonas sp. CN]
MANIDDSAIENFRAALRGPLLLPDDPGYDEARSIWNAMIDRRPALIARCSGTSDVMSAVNFAREHDLLLAVRGGGHNIAGNAVCDGGLMLDLSLMQSVWIDPEARLAYVEAGATLADFDHEAQAFGLATPLGINSTTGVAGLTLGGGFGWLSRRHGMSVDNLVAAEIVTADGKRLWVSAAKHPELFWAIRGGGGNFGVVTLFEFALHPFGPEVLTGLLVFPFDQAKQVLTRYRDFVDGMPEDLSVWAVLRQAPPLPFLAPEVHGKEVVVLAIFYAGDIEDGRRAIEPLRSIGQPCGEFIGVQPYSAWQKTFDPLLAPGARNYWKSHNFSALSDAAIDTVIRYAGQLPGPQCEIFLGLIGGQASRPAPDATAYANRDTLYAMNVHTRWNDPAEDAKCIAWARAFFDAAAPYASGSVYVNFLTQDESSRISAAYGPNYQRLVQVKNQYDPHNLFRHNQNIKPSI